MFVRRDVQRAHEVSKKFKEVDAGGHGVLNACGAKRLLQRLNSPLFPPVKPVILKLLGNDVD